MEPGQPSRTAREQPPIARSTKCWSMVISSLTRWLCESLGRTPKRLSTMPKRIRPDEGYAYLLP